MTTVKRKNGVFLSFLLGSAIGGAMGLLFAPESGKHLRYDINRKMKNIIVDGKIKANDLWNDAKDKAENTLDIANDVLNSNVDKIVHETGRVKDAFISGYDAYNKERKS